MKKGEGKVFSYRMPNKLRRIRNTHKIDECFKQELSMGAKTGG